MKITITDHFNRSYLTTQKHETTTIIIPGKNQPLALVPAVVLFGFVASLHLGAAITGFLSYKKEVRKYYL